MPQILNERFISWARSRFYRSRFLFNYIIIGIFAIGFELYIHHILKHFIPVLYAQILGIVAGIVAAFFLNFTLNFKMPRRRMNRSFCIFSLLSIISLLLSSQTLNYVISLGFTYEASRYVTSGALFYIAYYFHRKYSFKEFKKVGVAVYANPAEDIKGIWSKIGLYPDFIHVDIVDGTFNQSAPDPALYRMETMKAYWDDKEIHCHLMSKKPSEWLERVLPYVDTCLIHCEINENIDENIEKIRLSGVRVGICIMMETPIEKILPYLSRIDEVLLLTIPEPGRSGQGFDSRALQRISFLNELKNRNSFTLTVDGGINAEISSQVSVDKLVSGSFVLNNKEPVLQIMRLQTSSRYEILA